MGDPGAITFTRVRRSFDVGQQPLTCGRRAAAGGPGKLTDNWTFRTVVAMAVLSQVAKGMTHRGKRPRLLVKQTNVLQRYCLNVSTRT